MGKSWFWRIGNRRTLHRRSGYPI